VRAIELVSPLSPGECAARLLAAIDPEGLHPVPGSQPVIGRLAGLRMRLRKRLPGENSFQAVLLGTLEPRGEGTAVRCRVGMHPGVAGCMIVWVAAAGLGSAAMAVNLARGGAGGGPLWAVVVPVLVAMFGVIMVAFGGGVVWLGRQSAHGEDVFLVAFVADVIAARRGPEAEPHSWTPDIRK